MSKKKFNCQPINLTQFRYGKIALRFKKPRKFIPRVNDTGRLVVIDDGYLGLVGVHGHSRRELIKELKIWLVILWHDYVLEKDKALSPEARKIKKHLLRQLEQIS